MLPAGGAGGAGGAMIASMLVPTAVRETQRCGSEKNANILTYVHPWCGRGTMEGCICCQRVAGMSAGAT